MTTTPTPNIFGPDTGGAVMELLLASFENGIKMIYRELWSALTSFLVAHWLLVAVVLVTIFVIAFVRALMGGWGMLGRVLYRYIYFGILLVVGLIWGPDVFVTNIFSIASTVLLYPVCYFVTGWILRSSGLMMSR